MAHSVRAPVAGISAVRFRSDRALGRELLRRAGHIGGVIRADHDDRQTSVEPGLECVGERTCGNAANARSCCPCWCSAGHRRYAIRNSISFSYDRQRRHK